LARGLQTEEYTADEVVFMQGDDGLDCYIIRKGTVGIRKDGANIRTLGKGDYVGERALLQTDVRSATVYAAEDCELWRMGKATFQDIMTGQIADYLRQRIGLQDTKIQFNELTFVRLIGRGGFGVVKKVKSTKTGDEFALKALKKRQIVENCQQEAAATERNILAEVDHPFLLKFVRSFKSDLYIFS